MIQKRWLLIGIGMLAIVAWQYYLFLRSQCELSVARYLPISEVMVGRSGTCLFESTSIWKPIEPDIICGKVNNLSECHQWMETGNTWNKCSAIYFGQKISCEGFVH